MIVGEEDVGIGRESAHLGYALKILMDTGRRGFSLAAMHVWLTTPIRLNQIAFVLNARGVPLAFATWAFVTPPTAERIAAGRGRAPMLEEWNDGTILWVVDVVAPHGNPAALLRCLRDAFGQHGQPFGFTDRRTGKVRLMRCGTPSEPIARPLASPDC